MLKRLVSLVVGVTVACSVVGAFAASISTTTEYDTTNPGKINVTSVVSGVDSSAPVTYLAYKGDKPVVNITGNDVIYIDQVSENTTISYSTDKENIGATLLSNAPLQSTIPAGATTIKFDNQVVGTYEGNGEGFVTIEYADSALVSGIELGDKDLVYGTDYLIAMNGNIKINASYLVSNEPEVNFTLIKDSTTDAVITLINSFVGFVNGSENFRRITVAANAKGSSDYGIVLKHAQVDGRDETKCKAVAKDSDGNFVIVLNGLENLKDEIDETDGEKKIEVYAYSGDQEVLAEMITWN